MKFTYRTKDRLIRTFILGMLGVLIFAYYQIEISKYPYANYKVAVALFKKHDAELNEAVILVRAGILTDYVQYDGVISALAGLYDVVDMFKKSLEQHPNVKLATQLSKLEKMLNEEDRLITEFNRLNPILSNATHDFSVLMVDIIESATQTNIVEQFSIRDYNPEHYEFINKINELFRNVLIYTGGTQNEALYLPLIVTLLESIKNNPLKSGFPKLDLAIKYAETILDSQQKITAVFKKLLSISTITELDKLATSYGKLEAISKTKANLYRYVFYVLSVLLLTIIHFAFKRLQNVVHQLDETNQQLEQRVIQRTQDLANKNEDLNKAVIELHETQDQLIIQEKMASVGMLTTGIAHEIKNPLNFINNFSELSNSLSLEFKTLLEKEKSHISEPVYTELYELSSDIESNCKKIKEYGTRADNIVNSMLLHSKESSIQKEKTKIRPLIENAVKLAIHNYKTQNPSFDVSLKMDFDPHLTYILASPSSLSQAFVFILSNACWALDEKLKLEKLKSKTSFSPLIRITTQKKEDNIILTFFDNGIGIPEKNLTKVFEPFFTTRPTGFGNIGLGLSICYDIITKQHKGTFSVASTEGDYTEFTITLSITQQDHA